MAGWVLLAALLVLPACSGEVCGDEVRDVPTGECLEACLDDPAMQKFFKCAGKTAKGCIDLAEDCAADDGECICRAAFPGVQCRCDGELYFSLPDVKFHDVQVLSAFPAFLDDKGAVSRVCGAPLAGEPDLQPNALELVVNFVGTELQVPRCRNGDGSADRDNGIQEGELIELRRLRTTGAQPSVTAGTFELEADCLDERESGTDDACTSGPKVTAQAAAVRYARIADRCDPKRHDTWQNVALVMDHSGSVSGLVDGDTLLEEQPSKVHFPVPVEIVHKSDPYNVRVGAAMFLVDWLNDHDRALAYYFDEKVGAQVACSDSKRCVYVDDPPRSDAKCATDKDCPGGMGCVEDPSLTHDRFVELPLSGGQANQQNTCFADGADPAKRAWIELGLDQKVKFDGSGRAPLWQTVDTAYTFLTGSKADGNAGLGAKDPKHIVVVVDGPDTCTESEHFNYIDLSGQGQCRKKCETAEVEFAALVAKMHAANWPVHLHFVHWQAPAYRQPDARMMELACRSQGTYQFLNTEEIEKKDPTQQQALMIAALARIRNGLAGTWRPTFKLADLAGGATLPPGQLQALEGSLKFLSPDYLSPDSVYEYSDAWRFSFQGAEDHRLLFRRACRTAADCGGSSECGENHCTGAGLCEAKPARDQLPCDGGKGRCCGGKCQAGDCANACK